MDDLTGFKQPAEKDWRDNVYTGKNMPPESAQRELREKEHRKGEWQIVALPILLVGLVVLVAYSAYTLFNLFAR